MNQEPQIDDAIGRSAMAGWNSDRSGDRFRDAFALTVVLAAALLLLGVGSTPALVVEALVILYVRTRVMSERRVRAAALAQPLAVSL